MKRLIKICVCTLVLICTVFGTAGVFASDNALIVDVNPDNYSITVSGELDAILANKRMTLIICKENTNISSIVPVLNEQGYIADVAYLTSTAVNSDGSYAFDAYIPVCDSGMYDVNVFVSGVSTPYTGNVYITSEEKVNAFEYSFNNDNVADLQDTLDSEITTPTVGIDMSLYDMLSPSQRLAMCNRIVNERTGLITYTLPEAYEIINQYSAEFGILSFKDAQSLSKYFRFNELAITQAQKDEISTVLDYENSKEISTIKEFLELQEAGRISLLSKLTVKTYANISEIYDAIGSYIIHNSLVGTTHYTSITGVLDKYDDVLTALDYTTYKASRYKADIDKALLNRAHSTIALLCSYINDAAINGLGTTPSSPNGGFTQTTRPSGAVVGGAGMAGGSAGQQVNPNPSTGGTFNDLNSVEWAKEDIMFLASKGIINGKSSTEFCPNDFVTREEFCKMLVLAFDVQSANTEISFEDVNENSWFYSYVKTAYENGIINGINESCFGAGMFITRQDASVMASRTVKGDSSNTNLVFTDADGVSDYAKSSIGFMAQSGVISGFEDGSFRPMEKCTRAQAAKIIRSLMNTYASGGNVLQ